MDDRDFRRLYSRAAKYGLAVPEGQLIQNVIFEDKERFKQTLHACSYKCPECGKTHGFSQDDIQALILASMAKSLGRFGFTSVCPNSRVLLSMSVNCRKNGYASPIYNLKCENVKIEAKSLNRLAFESENFKNLSIEQLNKIVAYHEDKKGSHSENAVSKALEEMQLRSLEEPKPEIELVVPKRKSLLSKIKVKLKNVHFRF